MAACPRPRRRSSWVCSGLLSGETVDSIPLGLQHCIHDAVCRYSPSASDRPLSDEVHNPVHTAAGNILTCFAIEKPARALVEDRRAVFDKPEHDNAPS
jgi:hypothetical protein